MLGVIFVSVLFLEFAFGADAPSKVSPKIIDQEYETHANGYNFRYRTDDGQSRTETGNFVEKNDKTVLVVNGWFSYRFDGKTYFFVYSADENGYKSSVRFALGPGSQEGTAALSIEPQIGSVVLASLAGGGLG